MTFFQQRHSLSEWPIYIAKKTVMTIEKTYCINRDHYDSDGRDLYDYELLFSDQIRDFEKDFMDEHSKIFAANYLFLNKRLMKLLESCFNLPENETFGMALINGTIDFETDFKIEKHSRYTTIYAIGTLKDEAEPLYLIIDDNLNDTQVVLKHITDDDDLNNYEKDLPVNQISLIS